MADTDDRLMDLLATLDPTCTDSPPAQGSFRYASIQEKAMRSRAPSRGRGVFVAAAAAVAVAVVAFGVLQPAGRQDASAAVRAAAVNTGEFGSLRAELNVVYADGRSLVGTAEVDGPDMHIDTLERSYDGVVSHRESYTVFGDTIWTTIEGVTTSEPIRPNDRLDPFAEASEAVVIAALKGSEVSDLGTESLGDLQANHYRIMVDDASRAALGALPPSTLAWLELEYPEQVTMVDLWVSDGLIRQVRVESEECAPACSVSSTSTTELFDFNADITIEPPA